MALHRDIYWVGRQWAVTGHGIQACDQKQKGQFDIEASRIWDEGILESVRALKWLNAEDFDKAISVARKHYPEPPGRSAPPEKPVAQPDDDVLPARESPKPVGRAFEMQTDGLRARFVQVWRVRTRSSVR